jgi:hypothetical protein
LAHWVLPAKGLSKLVALTVGAVAVPLPVVLPVPLVVLVAVVVDAVPGMHWE